MVTITEQLKRNRAFSCLECGKCTAVCPISQANGTYSPRRLVAEGLFYGGDDLVSDQSLWSCLTCLLCSARCPVDVRYSEYMRDVRADAHRQGKSGQPTHSGALHAIMEMASDPDLKQSRTDWIDADLKVQEKGDVLYFVGCLPYYEGLFGKDFSFSPVDIAKDTVRILNRLGIEPVVSNDERCCGHDLYWLGQQEKFEALGRLNADVIKASGAKTVVTACPECALALRELYIQHLGVTGFKVKHISELVAEHADRLSWNGCEGEVTFQDPCRLGRFLDIYDEPRKVLEAIPGLQLREMQRTRRGAICCGTTNWTHCDATSKQIQRRRLSEAQQTGAKTLVTACPKCQIHFRCTKCSPEGEKLDIEVTDFVNIVAAALKDEDAGAAVGE
jgi:Fe-S oxidoreductase